MEKEKNYYYSVYWTDGVHYSDYDGFTAKTYREALAKRQHYLGMGGTFTIFKIEKETENPLGEFTFDC